MRQPPLTMVLFDEDAEVLTRVKARPQSPPPVCMVSSKAQPSRTPTLRKVLSAPTLKRTDQPMEAEAKARLAKFRNGMDEDMRALDAAAAIRKRNQRDAEYAAKAELAMRRGYQKAIDASRAPARPAWSPVEPMAYFSVPGAERGGSSCCVKNEQQQGIYDVPTVGPPHKEVNSVCGWVDCDAALREFGTKPRQFMGPTERSYAKKLEQVIGEIRQAELEEQQRLRDGKELRRRAQAAGGDFSALNRQKPPWATQLCCPTYFSSLGPSAVKDECDPHLKEYIEQPERTTSHARDIVVGDPQRQSHWVPRTGVAGSSERLAKAQELLQPPCMRQSR